jgi:hypothetical protein
VWCRLRGGDSSDEAIDSKDVDSNNNENEANENEVVDDSDDDRTIWSFAKTKADGVFVIAVVSLVAWLPSTSTGTVR